MMRRILRVLLLTTTFGSLPQLLAGDLRITLPKRSNPTPVQALNQQGVNEVRKHHLEKAEKLFYRAYLIDPDDPFTLNNLGYISELEGNVERAQRYYQLAARQNSETTIDRASEDELKETSHTSDPEMLDADRTPKVTKLLKMQQINLP